MRSYRFSHPSIRFTSQGILLAVSLALTSCGDDPQLVQKHGEQQAEIARLEGELALLQERLKNVPPDQSGELKDTVAEAAKLESERERLSEDVSALEAEHKALLEKFEDYKRKYAVQ